jgi:hypothetical protein
LRDTETWVRGLYRQDDASFLAGVGFLVGILAPFADGRTNSLSQMLPDDLLLGLASVLLGSSFYYGYGSILVSVSLGVRLSQAFAPFSDAVSFMVGMMDRMGQGSVVSGGGLIEPPPLSIDSFYASALVLSVGTILCFTAARFGAGIHYRNDVLLPLIIFTICAAGMFYLGAW